MGASNHVNGVIAEYAEGIEVIKAFNQSSTSCEKFSSQKKFACFLCNSSADTVRETIDKNFPPEIITSAITIDSFGGYPPFAKGDAKTGAQPDSVVAFAQIVKQAI